LEGTENREIVADIRKSRRRVGAGGEEARNASTSSGHFEFVKKKGEGGIIRWVVHRGEYSRGILNGEVLGDNWVDTKSRREATELEVWK
jgi:hypothetical protein